jgi:hypothetical protein
MLDRRRTPRMRAFKGGKIEFNRHWPTVDCVVRNISKAGAFLELPDNSNTPMEFSLVFTTTNESRACRQIWRQGTTLGVQFA